MVWILSERVSRGVMPGLQKTWRAGARHEGESRSRTMQDLLQVRSADKFG